VAAPPLPRLIRTTLRAAAVLALAAGLFVIAGWLGSTIPRNSGWREPERGITILIETNGTHTGIVMPLRTREKDWAATFPEIMAMRGGEATHVAVGWGEREVFLGVPTWGDLHPLTALRILTTGGQSVMRVTPYVRPAPSEYHRPVRLTQAQYRRLVRRIDESLAAPDRDGMRRSLPGTDRLSLYYPARGRYTLVRTCNSWVGDMLGDAGVRMGAWTPFAGGVMKWVTVPTGA